MIQWTLALAIYFYLAGLPLANKVDGLSDKPRMILVVLWPITILFELVMVIIASGRKS